MKSLVFDTSSIISIVTNDLLWILDYMKKKFNGEFYIPDSVKFELVDKPMTTKMFKLEAIMINKAINDGQIVVHNKLDVDDLLQYANSIYSVNKRPLHILDKAEIEALALVLRLQSDAYVVDERTMRLVIEDPYKLKEVLESKIHRRVNINKNMLKNFSNIVKGVNLIRSAELMTIAYENGFLNKFITPANNEKDLLDGLLWGLRLRGCAISTDEINEIIKFEIKK